MKMIIFAHGYDGPGIGASLTKVLFEKNCKIENFKIISLDGFFALMVSVSSDEYLGQSELEETIKDTVHSQISIKVCDCGLPKSYLKLQKVEWVPYQVKMITGEQTSALFYFLKQMAELGVNVSDVCCEKSGTGEDKTYRIINKIQLPVHLTFEMLKTNLDEIATNTKSIVDINSVDDLEM